MSRIPTPKGGAHPTRQFTEILALLLNRVLSPFVLGNGGTAGNAALTVPLNDMDLAFIINGRQYALAPGAGTAVSDDLFDLSAFVDLTAGQYCKVLFTLTTAGAGKAYRGDVAASQAAAVLPEVPDDEAMVGYATAGSAGAGVDWDDVGGLAGQGIGYVYGIFGAL